MFIVTFVKVLTLPGSAKSTSEIDRVSLDSFACSSVWIASLLTLVILTRPWFTQGQRQPKVYSLLQLK